MIPVPGDILAAAEETCLLELAAGASESIARLRAIGAALAAQDLRTRAEMVQQIIRLAEQLDDDDDDLACDGPAALLWFARAIQETLPQD